MKTQQAHSRRLFLVLLFLSSLLAACGQARTPDIVNDIQEGAAIAQSAVPVEPTAAATSIAEPTTAAGGDQPEAAQELEPFIPPLEAELPRSVMYSGLEWTVTEAVIDNHKVSLFGDSDELSDRYRVARITMKLKNPLSGFTDVETSALKLQIGDGDPIKTDDSRPLNLPEGNSTATSELAFILPIDATWKDAKLVLSESDLEPAVIPLEGPMPAAAYPVELAASGEGKTGNETYTVLGASLDLNYRGHRAELSTRYLILQVRASYEGTARLAVTSDTFRLVIDDVPMEPEEAMAEVVAPQSAKEGEVVFVVPATVTSAELRVGEEEPATIALDL